MKAMVLEEVVPSIEAVQDPLKLKDLPIPRPGPRELLIKILACGICRTELDEIEGRRRPRLPVIPGHEVVGIVEQIGEEVKTFQIGQRVGVGWINWACGVCRYCQRGEENLCESFKGTGCDADGGYAEYMVVDERFAVRIPEGLSDLEAAPLLCAGAIGYRSLRLSGMKDGEVLGLFGFGASGHIVLQVVRCLYPNAKVFVFTRKKGDPPSRLAEELGADWVGETGQMPPEKLNRAIDTTPSGEVVKEALRALDKGGRLVINAIRKETTIPELDYAQYLWEEREVKSVANVTKRDIEEFLELAPKVPIRPEVTVFGLEEANKALLLLKKGGYRGAGVLKIKG